MNTTSARGNRGMTPALLVCALLTLAAAPTSGTLDLAGAHGAKATHDPAATPDAAATIDVGAAATRPGANAVSTPARGATRAALPVYDGPLMDADPNGAQKKGALIAALNGSELAVLVHFGGLSVPWGQIDLFRGDPRAGGALIQNLAIAVPAPPALSGGMDAAVELSVDDLAALEAGNLFVRVSLLTNVETAHLYGNLQVMSSALDVVETRLSHMALGVPSTRGRALAALDGDVLHVAGYFHLNGPWTRVDLMRGLPGEPSELVENLSLLFSGSTDVTGGFEANVVLSDAQRTDLMSGRLFVEVQSADDAFTSRGQLLVFPNQAPAASVVQAPGPGASLVIGGATDPEAVDPSAHALDVTIATATDPDGNPVQYYWQLSRGWGFSPGITATVSLGTETATSFTVGELAELFDRLWSGFNIPRNSAVTLYHRAVTFDGAVFTYGMGESAEVVRGSVTSTDGPGSGLTFRLGNLYPNPVVDRARVSVELPALAEAWVEVYDLLGRRVQGGAPRMLPAGTAEIDLDVSQLAAGAYLYRVYARSGGSSLHGGSAGPAGSAAPVWSATGFMAVAR